MKRDSAGEKSGSPGKAARASADSSKPQASKSGGASNKNAEQTPDPRATWIGSPRPLKPRRKIFIILFGILLIWVAALLWMYFATVLPVRHGAPPH